jgi:hypothetical protein
MRTIIFGGVKKMDKKKIYRFYYSQYGHTRHGHCFYRLAKICRILPVSTRCIACNTTVFTRNTTAYLK